MPSPLGPLEQASTRRYPWTSAAEKECWEGRSDLLLGALVEALRREALREELLEPVVPAQLVEAPCALWGLRACPRGLGVRS